VAVGVKAGIILTSSFIRVHTPYWHKLFEAPCYSPRLLTATGD